MTPTLQTTSSGSQRRLPTTSNTRWAVACRDFKKETEIEISSSVTHNAYCKILRTVADFPTTLPARERRLDHVGTERARPLVRRDEVPRGRHLLPGTPGAGT